MAFSGDGYSQRINHIPRWMKILKEFDYAMQILQN
jgi:hypothetical protein